MAGLIYLFVWKPHTLIGWLSVSNHLSFATESRGRRFTSCISRPNVNYSLLLHWESNILRAKAPSFLFIKTKEYFFFNVPLSSNCWELEKSFNVIVFIKPSFQICKYYDFIRFSRNTFLRDVDVKCRTIYRNVIRCPIANWVAIILYMYDSL